jgi:protocatechuate 3,4-dioxygenase alpha subunit
MKAGAPLVATSSQTVGPFFHFALSPDARNGEVHNVGGPDRIQLLVRVTDGDGAPVGDAIVEIWQRSPDLPESGFGRMATGEDGTCEFETVRAPHINVCLFARGLLRHLHTRIYFAGDPGLGDDAVLALVPDDRRATLIASPDALRAGRWVFDLRLQGSGETVFFDV